MSIDALTTHHADLWRFPVDLSQRSSKPHTVTRGLDPRVHFLRIDFAKMMDARVKPAHDDRVEQIDREPL
jgi:hypothetical protein